MADALADTTDAPPITIARYECPDCGEDLTGRRSYSIDESREKCSKTWHKKSARKVIYVRQFSVAKGLKEVLDELKQHYPSEDENERIEHTEEAIYDVAERFEIKTPRTA